MFKLKVKIMLKLRSKQEIANEILELESVKKAYFHFLGTNLRNEFPEMIEQIEMNYHLVKFYLSELYFELKNAKEIQPKPIAKTFVPVTVQHSLVEVKAIQLFNKDKRFSITE